MPCSYRENKVSFILINSIILIIVGIIFFLTEFEIIPRFKQGFYCNDPKLMYPYIGDTVSNAAVTFMSILIPPLLILISETIAYFFDYEAFERREFLKHIKIAFIWCKEYIIFLGFNAIITFIFKYTFGEPRPDFIDTCKPNVCENLTSTIQNNYNFIYECTNKNLSSSIVNNASKSFLSGHAATSVFASLFTFWYVQKRMYTYSPRFVGFVLQIVFIAFGIVCSITRITDHRHHWWDVACGSILGALSSIFAITMFCNNFETHTLSSSRMFFSNKKTQVNDQHGIEIE